MFLFDTTTDPTKQKQAFICVRLWESKENSKIPLNYSISHSISFALLI